METPWGSKETEYFYSLTPDLILNSVERALDLKCTGRVLQLNSMENRVYEIEIEHDHPHSDPSKRFLIAKFYRPGRWSERQILEEHEFLDDLDANEIPVVKPMTLKNNSTIEFLENSNLYFSVFPKVGGRSPDELTSEQLRQVSRLLARMHNIGSIKSAKNRVPLTIETYGKNNLCFLLENGFVPMEIEKAYQETCESIFSSGEELYRSHKFTTIRLHGDCHLGNLLFGRESFFWVDFDDMVTGQPVQDLWLLVPYRGQESKEYWREIIDSYSIFREFDLKELQLVELLRSLRLIHFSAWIAKRWKDPAFPRAFPNFGSSRYWHDQLQDLRDQILAINNRFEV